jgi:predicted GIY-YIG superfamily endonuclease
MQTAVYRFYDAADALLYVGVAVDPDRRREQHKNKAWFPQAQRMDVAWYGSRDEAMAAEALAIREENPLHNRAGVDLGEPADCPVGIYLTQTEKSRFRIWSAQHGMALSKGLRFLVRQELGLEEGRLPHFVMEHLTVGESARDTLARMSGAELGSMLGQVRALERALEEEQKGRAAAESDDGIGCQGAGCDVLFCACNGEG